MFLCCCTTRVGSTILAVSAWVLVAGCGVNGHAEERRGEVLYGANCAACHGTKGEGFLNLYPPLPGSRFFVGDVAALPCIIRNGLSGEITVGQRVFNQIMPGNKRLSDADVEVLIGFLQRRWGREQPEINVREWLEQCD